jgi:hypothetical protein
MLRKWSHHQWVFPQKIFDFIDDQASKILAALHGNYNFFNKLIPLAKNVRCVRVSPSSVRFQTFGLWPPGMTGTANVAKYLCRTKLEKIYSLCHNNLHYSTCRVNCMLKITSIKWKRKIELKTSWSVKIYCNFIKINAWLYLTL